MEQQTNRSDQVIDRYQQHKISASVHAQIKALLKKFEAEDVADRRMAWIGVVVLVGLVIVAAYFFINGSQITVA